MKDSSNQLIKNVLNLYLQIEQTLACKCVPGHLGESWDASRFGTSWDVSGRWGVLGRLGTPWDALGSRVPMCALCGLKTSFGVPGRLGASWDAARRSLVRASQDVSMRLGTSRDPTRPHDRFWDARMLRYCCLVKLQQHVAFHSVGKLLNVS